MRKGVSNYSLSKGYLVIQDTIKLELCAHVQSSLVRCDIFLPNMNEKIVLLAVKLQDGQRVKMYSKLKFSNIFLYKFGVDFILARNVKSYRVTSDRNCRALCAKRQLYK